MTVHELAALPGNTVGTKATAEALGCDRWSVTLMAKNGSLPVRFFFSGNRLHVVKASLLEYLGYKPEEKPGEKEGAA